MKIAVCVKIVKGEISPFDASAVEAALKLSRDVTIYSMAPESAKGKLSELTRLGVRAVLISDPHFAGSDTLATGYILSKALKKENYDIILCGRQSTDSDTAQVGPCISSKLGIPLIAYALDIKEENGTVFCRTRLGDEQKKTPVLVTVERMFELRFPSFRSKVGTVTVLDAAGISADVKRCGLSGSPTKVIKTFYREESERKCRFIEPEELSGLIKKLSSKERVKLNIAPSEKKLKEIWAVGKEVKKQAEAIAEKVVYIDEKDPCVIAERAKKEQPEVILWNADLASRRDAPIAAAILETGLCADCTALETDGKKLYMYRPALGGDMTAKIECKTRPQMATVRTESDSADILLSIGRGAEPVSEKLRAFAKKIGAGVGASRAVVDMEAAPYEEQIGLTGKTASPKIYIAVGISGAVQHMCAVEGAGSIIAVNPDKDAPIFKYADYGIIARAEDIIKNNG